MSSQIKIMQYLVNLLATKKKKIAPEAKDLFDKFNTPFCSSEVHANSSLPKASQLNPTTHKRTKRLVF